MYISGNGCDRARVPRDWADIVQDEEGRYSVMATRGAGRARGAHEVRRRPPLRYWSRTGRRFQSESTLQDIVQLCTISMSR
jgi:hypothetical protein